MIRFVHTADIHFGMENYGHIDPKTGIHSRLLDFQKALNICIDYAIEHDVDFFLFSGDAYKTTNPSPTQQKLLLKCFLRLHEKRIPIVIVIGNHDNPLSFGKAHTLDLFNELPLSGFHVISKPSHTPFILQTKSGPIAIVGMPWPTRNTLSLSDKHAHKSASQITEHISNSVAKMIQHAADNIDPTMPAVLAGHLTVSSGIFSGSEKRAIYGTDPLLLPSQLALPVFDYVALGHLHRYQNLNPNGYPAIVYSGSIERIDFGERKEEKGFCVVSIPEKGRATHEFIQVPTRSFLQIELTLTNEKNQTEQVIQEIKKYDIVDAVIKIIYHVPLDTKDAVSLPEVQKACSSAWYIVGIIPVRAYSVRERRALMNVNMDLESMVTTYFESKPELKERKDILIEKTLSLSQEAQQVTDPVDQ
ncbi:MAG: exonuclease SbcCD subunit D [Candidatus Dependentiae bacterium]|nr:exonuclease SbcCD subunit D [Candidatus Dependentiae bacterium]